METHEFDDFFRQVFPFLVGFLVKLGYDRAAAEDAAQEAMTQAYTNWANIRQPAAWVWRTAARIASNTARRLRYGYLKAVEGGWVAAEEPANDTLVLNEQQQLVLDVLRGLPSRQRAVLAWSFDGFSVQEIAAQLDMTESTVRSNLRHARQALQARYPSSLAATRQIGEAG